MLSSIVASTLALTAQTAGFDAATLLDSQDEAVVARLAACDIDTEEFGRLMALSQQDFDQDFDGGWRPYGEREGCAFATGELIGLYRDHAPSVEPNGLQILNWHAGQMYAYAEARARAIPLFAAAKDNDGGAWDLYADVTIAFLQGDRATAEAAREALLAFAPDEAEQAARQRFLDENPNIRMPDGFVTDPPNLGPVDRLLGCWEGSYREAYSGGCERENEAPEVDLTVSPSACAIIAENIRAMHAGAGEGSLLRVGAQWLNLPVEREGLAATLRQKGRQIGPDDHFGLDYSADFAASVETLSEADIDRFFANLTTPDRVDGVTGCPSQFDADQPPFVEDIKGLTRWAIAQMSNPDPDAPPAVQTLSVSRPTLFDDGTAALVASRWTLAPIPLQRAPIETLSIRVYQLEDGYWRRQSALLLSRGD